MNFTIQCRDIMLRLICVFGFLCIFSMPGLNQTAGKLKPEHAVRLSPHALDDLLPGHWLALGENTLYDVRYVPEPDGKPIHGIMNAWSGAAFNTDTNQLWVHGGGHGDCADNAVYSFDVDTLRWTRLFDPSTTVQGHTGRYYLDGKPAAVHSYDYVEYLPCLRRLVVAGARGPYPGVAAYTTVDAVDSNGDWLRLQDVPSCVHPSAAVHPDTGILWQHGGEGNGFLSSYDGHFNQWIPHGQWNTDNYHSLNRTCCIDPFNELFVALNVGSYSDSTIWIWDISGGHTTGIIAGEPVGMTGDTDILYVAAPPGMDWHAGNQKLYAWYGGVDVYEIDLARNLITKVEIDPDNTVIPTPGTLRGVFGRWRHVETYDVFMGVNAVDEPVYFFRLPERAPVPSLHKLDNRQSIPL